MSEQKNWREGLPKWRLEAIDKELRHGALSWPTESRPTPAPFWWDYDHRITQGTPEVGTYWTFNRGYRHVEKVVITKNEDPKDAFSHRSGLKFNKSNQPPQNRLFMSQREARLALIWHLCDEYAGILAIEKSQLLEDQS